MIYCIVELEPSSHGEGMQNRLQSAMVLFSRMKESPSSHLLPSHVPLPPIDFLAPHTSVAMYVHVSAGMVTYPQLMKRPNERHMKSYVQAPSPMVNAVDAVVPLPPATKEQDVSPRHPSIQSIRYHSGCAHPQTSMHHCRSGAPYLLHLTADLCRRQNITILCHGQHHDPPNVRRSARPPTQWQSYRRVIPCTSHAKHQRYVCVNSSIVLDCDASSSLSRERE